MDTVGQRDRFPSAFVEENTLPWEEQGWPVVGGTWDQHMLTSGLGMRTVLFATGLLIAFFPILVLRTFGFLDPHPTPIKVMP